MGDTSKKYDFKGKLTQTNRLVSDNQEDDIPERHRDEEYKVEDFVARLQQLSKDTGVYLDNNAYNLEDNAKMVMGDGRDDFKGEYTLTLRETYIPDLNESHSIYGIKGWHGGNVYDVHVPNKYKAIAYMTREDSGGYYVGEVQVIEHRSGRYGLLVVDANNRGSVGEVLTLDGGEIELGELEVLVNITGDRHKDYKLLVDNDAIKPGSQIVQVGAETGIVCRVDTAKPKTRMPRILKGTSLEVQYGVYGNGNTSLTLVNVKTREAIYEATNQVTEQLETGEVMVKMGRREAGVYCQLVNDGVISEAVKETVNNGNLCYLL